MNGKSSSAPPPFYVMFFGKWARLARWCHAQVSQAGREAKRHDRVCGAGVVDLLLLLHLDKTPHFMHIGTMQQISHIHVASCSCTCSTIVRIALSLCSNSAQSLSTQRSSMHSEKLGSARKCRSKRSQGALPGRRSAWHGAERMRSRMQRRCTAGVEFSDRGMGTCVGAELRGAECKEAHAQQAQSTTKPRSDPFCGTIPIVGSAPVRARDTSIQPFCGLGLFAISSRNSCSGFLTVMILVYAPLSPLQHLTTPPSPPRTSTLPYCHLLGYNQVSKTEPSCLVTK